MFLSIFIPTTIYFISGIIPLFIDTPRLSIYYNVTASTVSCWKMSPEIKDLCYEPPN